MRKILLFTIVLVGCVVNLTTDFNSKYVSVDTLQLNKERSLRNLTDESYCDSIGLTDMFKLTKEDLLASKHKHGEVVKKYLNKLPHKDIQIKYIIKHKIDPAVAILINFQESTFEEVINNGNLNKGKFKDWGTLQLNGGYFPRGKNSILKGDYETYYDYAYSIMKDKKPSTNNLKRWFTNWNSFKDEQADKYFSSFIDRTAENNKDLRLLLL